MPRNLVIVESPAKSKTVARYLNSSRNGTKNAKSNGADHFEILATGGHIRESNQVDIENGFELRYTLISTKKNNVDKIVAAMRKSDQLFLATDPDREGEAISAHVEDELRKRGVLKSKPVHRIVFYEVTSDAVRKAIENPGEISENLVEAQKSRDALDMLIGFNLSPHLIRKLSTGHLSAGRVQSPALRLIVERQREIERFIPQEYWKIQLELTKDNEKFESTLTHRNGKKLNKFSIGDQQTVNEIVSDIESEILGKDKQKRICISNISKRNRLRRPRPPFTTSTLVQEASSKLRMPARLTARVAQRLYEGLPINGVQTGLISYTRTDSTTLSATALGHIRKFIGTEFGKQDLPVSSRLYRTKSKNAQEAHEAIRPTDISRTPRSVRDSLDKQQFALYELIWCRAVASQMKDAVFDSVAVDFETANHRFRANGSTLRYPGWLRVYQNSTNPPKDSKGDNSRLPDLAVNESVDINKIKPTQHFTQPPPRYNQGSLIKQLEDHGIGRPSTWPTIITKLIDRNYVVLEKQNLVAKSLGCIVVDYLSAHFEKYIDYEFTSRLEDELDGIARGEKKRLELLDVFWQKFSAELEDKKSLPRYERALGSDPESGRDLIARVRKGGAFLQLGRMNDHTKKKPQFQSLSPDMDPSTLTFEKAIELMKQNVFPRSLGQLDDGKKVAVSTGQYGPYFSIIDADGKKKNHKLRKDLDPLTVTLDEIRVILSEQTDVRLLGQTEEGYDITVLWGRYGPYISVARPNSKLNVTLNNVDSPKTLTLERAIELIEEKKKNPFKKGKTIIKQFEDSKIQVLDGRYGPYASNGKINVTIPKDLDPSSIDLETCQQLIEKKAGQSSASKKKRSTTKKKSTRRNVVKQFENSDFEILNGRYGPYVTNGKINATVPKGLEPNSLDLETCQQLIEKKARLSSASKKKRPAPKRKSTRKQ